MLSKRAELSEIEISESMETPQFDCLYCITQITVYILTTCITINAGMHPYIITHFLIACRLIGIRFIMIMKFDVIKRCSMNDVTWVKKKEENKFSYQNLT